MMLKTKLIYEFSLSAVARVLELKNRFSQGLEKTTDLLQSETQMYQRIRIYTVGFRIQFS
jgi:hypothetical protein